MRSRHSYADWHQIRNTLSCGKVMVFMFCRLTATSQFLTRAYCPFRFGIALVICQVLICAKSSKNNFSRTLQQILSMNIQLYQKELRHRSFITTLETLHSRLWTQKCYSDLFGYSSHGGSTKSGPVSPHSS